VICFLQESYLENLGETRSTADCTVDLGPMTPPLVDILHGLKRNTFAWAKLWVLNGAPDEFYPNEHHIITAALIPFRARYRDATEEEQHNLQQFLIGT
jgi:hypothetical protein